MSSLRNLRWAAYLALAVFACWISLGAIHQHSEDPTCQLCKLLHSSVAEPGRPPDAFRLVQGHESVFLGPSDEPAAPSLQHARVRGPPAA